MSNKNQVDLDELDKKNLDLQIEKISSDSDEVQFIEKIGPLAKEDKKKGRENVFNLDAEPFYVTKPPQIQLGGLDGDVDEVEPVLGSSAVQAPLSAAGINKKVKVSKGTSEQSTETLRCGSKSIPSNDEYTLNIPSDETVKDDSQNSGGEVKDSLNSNSNSDKDLTWRWNKNSLS